MRLVSDPAQEAPAAAAPARDGVLPLRLRSVRLEARGRTLIDGVDMELSAGTRTVIIGPNGAGKSLLLRLCHGLLKPTAGHLQWAVPAGRRLRRAQAMVFQKPVLLRRSVRANIDYALAAYGVPRAERPARVLAALEEARLTGRARSPARLLSGGEQQRLALARAWAVRPQVLFLDEPSAHLDPTATRAVEQMLADFVAVGTKLVLTTHDLGQARRLGDEILFMHGGRLLERAAAADFFAGPVTTQARAFVEGRLLD